MTARASPATAERLLDSVTAVDRVKRAEPEVPWRDIVDMRNFLSHEDFRVLAEIVCRTIDEPLEQLRAACQRRLVAAGPDPAQLGE